MPAGTRENYYRALDLDPDVDDEDVIQRRIKEKQWQWSKQKTSGPSDVRRSAAANLEALHDIKRVMGDAESRREEARAAKRLVQQERQENYRLLDEHIELLSVNGTYTDHDLEQIKRSFKGVLDDAELEKRLRARGLTKAKEEERAKRSRLDPTIAKNIRLNLKAIGVDDLYQLLGLPSRSSLEALVARADELYKELKRLGATDNRSSARSELLGQCRRLFSSAERKAEYDLYMSEQVFEGLKATLDLAGVDRYLSLAIQDQLVAMAIKRGARPDLAEAYIQEYATSRKWGLQRRGGPSRSPIRVCGYCGAMADPTARSKRCSACGEPLEEPCPRCSASVPTNSARCSACGCNTGDASLVRALMAEGKEQLASGALHDARQTFERVLALWSDWGPARTALKDVQTRANTIEKEIAAIDKLIAKGRLAQAQADLEQAERRHGPAALTRVWDRLEKQLRVAAGHLAEGRRLERAGDKNGAIDAYSSALTVQSDCEEAKRALARCPPSAPSGLTAKPMGTGLALSWPPADGALDYIVVRKADGHPNGPDDGETSPRVRDTRYSDLEVPVGMPCYYAVYACRGPATSSTAALSGPHLRVSDVEDLRMLPGDSSITISWTRPPGCTEVEVRRATDLPPSAKAGQRIPASADHCVDTGLTNGMTFGYRITALFADPERPATRLRSQGLERSATPLAPPKPVLDLHAERRDNEFLLRWSPPARGHVEIRACTGRPTRREGDCIEASHTSDLGPVVPNRSADSCQYRPIASVSFVLPLTIAGDLAVVGRTVEVNALDPVSGLQSRHLGTTIVLTWDWPATVASVLILYRYDRFPGRHDDPQATAAVCTLAEYQRYGLWQLHSPEQRPHHFALFAAAGPGGPYAAGVHCVEPMGQEHTVRYALVRKRKMPFLPWGREVGLQLRSDSDLTLSNLVLVAKPRTLPLSPSDGMTLQEIRSIRLEQGLAWIPIDPSHLEPDTHLKLFFRDPSAAGRIRLQNAAAAAMRLGS